MVDLSIIRDMALALGFSQIGVVPLRDEAAKLARLKASEGLQAWLRAGHHGTMDYMQARAGLRADPTALMPSSLSVITVRMDYLPRDNPDVWRDREWQRIASPTQATVSLYARGRDYHKVMRGRLQTLAERIQSLIGPLGHRAFVDSAPLMEVDMATASGLGWRGKHTLALNRDAGSMFFLGELFVDVELPRTDPVSSHCGTCSACIDVCPTQAIVAPYRLDARRCIAYLTIEHEGSIEASLRPMIGNRVFGCDDCQLACPWNKHAQRSTLVDFDPRKPLDGPVSLLQLWDWDEAAFKQRAQGTVLWRSGYERWRRNLAVALGNALAKLANDKPASAPIVQALRSARSQASPMVAEHIDWALAQATP